MASIIEKLQKLIKHEKSVREIGNIDEAEAYAAKIQTLLTQHKLTMSEVEFENQDVVDPIGHEHVEHPGRSLPHWQQHLAQGIAQSFFCQCMSKVGSSTLVFIGRESDRIVAIRTYCYLTGLAKGLRAKAAKLYISCGQFEQEITAIYGPRYTPTQAARLTCLWNKSFLLGFAVAIAKRLTITSGSLEASAESTALTFILKDRAAVSDYVAEMFQMRAGTSRHIGGLHPGALHQGQMQGSEVSLTNRTAIEAGR